MDGIGAGFLIGLLLLGSLFAYYSIRHYSNYGNVPLAPVRLKREYVDFLKKHFSYYANLPQKSQFTFERRVAHFMQAKEFVPREMIAVSWEMKVLISASAIQLTFGFPNVHLSYFRYIVVFPGKFLSNATGQYHLGEVNPRYKSIVLGWRHFVEGYLKTDGRNLGLHEMAHALRLENRIMNHEYNFLNESALHEWELRATNTMKEISEGRETFFREYGATDREEFFAVAVENFFERPQEFSDQHPLTYNILCSLLNQDPISLLGR